MVAKYHDPRAHLRQVKLTPWGMLTLQERHDLLEQWPVLDMLDAADCRALRVYVGMDMCPTRVDVTHPALGSGVVHVYVRANADGYIGILVSKGETGAVYGYVSGVLDTSTSVINRGW